MLETGIDAVVDRGQAAADLLQFERLLSELAASFIALPAPSIDDAIEQALRRIVGTLDIDRSTLSSVDPETGRFHALHSVAATGLPPVPSTVSSRTFPWVLASMRAGKALVFSHLDELPPQAAEDRAAYAGIGLRSHVAIPVMTSGELMGVLGFGTMRHERTWPDDLVTRLRLLADIFAGALARKRAQITIDHALGFERLLADIAASLVSSREAELETDVVAGLRSVAQFLRVDRSTLWEFAPAPLRLVATHRWQSDDVPAPREAGATAIPWILDEVIGGKTVSFAAVDELPPAADIDKAALRAIGVRSLLAVPLRAKGEVIAALTLSCVRDERVWQDDLVPRLRLLGKMLVSALANGKAQAEAQRAQAETAQFRERLAHVARVHTVGAMSAAIAHEVNQPLMAIGNYAAAGRRRLAGDQAIDRAKLDELLTKIADQTALAGEVLDRLRSMVKRHDSEVIEVDMARLIGNTLKLVEMASQLREVRVETAIAPDLPWALADDVQIQQVILNLVHNAMDAMAASAAANRVLRLEAFADANDHIVVRIVDNGVGVAAKEAENIFEPFYTTKGTGLGMGLSICRAIVEAHGGKLWHTCNVPAGSVFQFTLPVVTNGA